MHKFGRAEISYEVPIDILQIENLYAVRSLRRLSHLDAVNIDRFRCDDKYLYSVLHQYRGLKLIMMVESVGLDHQDIEVHAYALKYCTSMHTWYKADENRPFMTRLSFASYKEYDWSLMVRKIEIASIEVTHVTKNQEQRF